MVTVTAVYERDFQGRWLVHIAEEPRCHTWARSAVSARREINAAAELWLEELGVESLDNLDIRDEVRIAGAAQARDLAEARKVIELAELIGEPAIALWVRIGRAASAECGVLTEMRDRIHQ